MPASDQRYGALVEEIRDYAIFMLDREGRVATWNRGAERILGYAEAEIVGQSAARRFTPEDVERGEFDRELREAAEKGRASDDRGRLPADADRRADGVRPRRRPATRAARRL